MSTVNALVGRLDSFALTAVIALVFGSGLLRFFGIASLTVALTFLFSEASQDAADAGTYALYVPMAVLGVVSWVLGHRLYRAQHGRWKSALAAGLWNIPAERLTRPTQRGRSARQTVAARVRPGGNRIRP